MAELSVEISAKVDKLLSELKKAKEGLNSIGVAAEGLVSKLKTVGEKMGRIGKSMTTYLTLPLAAIAGASIKMASDFTESLNKVDVAFKSSSKEVREFAKTTLETFGIAEGTALDMAALFGDMATSMGVPTNKAANLSTAMVGLAGDLSSFKNINISEVTTALNGVFTGETESLKRLGIVMTETNLKQFALSQGMSDNIQAMTQAQKVQLRYAYILENTKNAQGDFARTSDGSANQMRIFTESVKELSVAFGEILLPYFTKAITYVNGVVKAFTNLSPATKKIIVVVASLVAVVGPLLIALGFLSTTIIPALITGFGILISPIGLVIAGVAALVAAFMFFNRTTDDVIKKQTVLSQINNTAAKSISNEKAKLAELLFVAKNESIQKSARIKAIEELNALSPEFLGNLTLEKINTNEATTAVNLYNDALLKTAKTKAAQSKLQELSSKIIDLELQKEKDSVETAKKKLSIENDENNLISRKGKIIDITKNKIEAVNTLYNSRQILADRELVKLKDQEGQILKIIAANKTLNEVVSGGGGGGGLKKAKSLELPKSVKFPTLNLQQFDFLQEKILKFKDNTLGILRTIDFRDAPILTSTLSKFDEDALTLKAKLLEFNAGVGDIIQNSLVGTFAGLGNAIGEALATGGNVLSAIGGSIIQGLSNFLSEMGGMLVKYGTLAILKGKLDLAIFKGGPVAIGAGLAAVAVGIALSAAGSALGNMSSKGSNGTGSQRGQTGSSNFSGSNGGGNFGASNNSGGTVVFNIEGTKLVGVLSNTLKRNRSLGGSLSII
jgi:hypothetical protein